MKTKIIIIIVVIVLSVLIYLTIFKIPTISIELIDKLNKKATIRIGSQVINYNFDHMNGLQIPKIGFFYTGNIEPDGVGDFAILTIYRGNKPMTTRILDFTVIGT
jgi:hypothetical protein